MDQVDCALEKMSDKLLLTGAGMFAGHVIMTISRMTISNSNKFYNQIYEYIENEINTINGSN